MKYLTPLFLVLATSLVLTSAPIAQAGTLERACLKAGRDGASRVFCGCIDDIARPIFSRSEMRRIAKFFKEPHLSQELRQSSRRSDERLWGRYKLWGTAVENQCS